MRKLIFLLIYMSLLLAFIGCETTTTNLESEKYPYPLNPGNSWEFHRNFKMYTYPDSTELDSIIGKISGTDSVAMMVSGYATLRDSISTIKLLQESWQDTLITIGEYHYQTRDTGLFMIAYQNTYHFPLPKTTLGREYPAGPLIPGHIIKLFNENLSYPHKRVINNGLYFEEPPVYVLKYPLEKGVSWTYRYDPFQIDKKVVKDTTISVPAGRFHCSQIRYIYFDWDIEIYIDDFIADIGLVLRKIETRGPEGPRSDVFIITNDEYKLINYNLK